MSSPSTHSGSTRRRPSDPPPTPDAGANSSPAARRIDAELEARRALLADPAVIAAGGTASAAAPAPSKRSTAARTKRRSASARPARRAPEAPATQPAIAPPAQPVIVLPTQPAIAPPSRPQAAPSWERRALASMPPAATPAPTAVTCEERPGPLAAPSRAERALAAELREARATLAIARETAQRQRDEIARLRRQRLDAVDRTVAATPAPPRDDDRIRLAQRVATLEAERTESQRERGQLLESLARHERERAERERQLEALNDRLEVQSEALDRTRRELEQERRRHTEAQALLTRLRTALRSLDTPASDPEAEALDACAPPSISAATRPEAPAAPDASRSARIPPARRSAIFEHWREGQIRRHFGAFGIDGTADLVRDPLARRATASDRALAILLLGPGARAASRRLAEALLRGCAPPFVLHFADPRLADVARAREEDPLDAIVESVAYPTSPNALADLIRRIEPAVIVSRDDLTGRSDPADWLDALGTASASKACLVFLEETGQGRLDLAPELEAIGERIWALLPERYTRDAASGRVVARFREAFAACATGPRSSLLAALRARFDLELLAQFGLLAQAFVAGPVAACFDPSSARDRRFVEQIAELDDRRIEAGAGPALHLVARVDPLARS